MKTFSLLHSVNVILTLMCLRILKAQLYELSLMVYAVKCGIPCKCSLWFDFNILDISYLVQGLLERSLPSRWSIKLLPL